MCYRMVDLFNSVLGLVSFMLTFLFYCFMQEMRVVIVSNENNNKFLIYHSKIKLVATTITFITHTYIISNI